MSLEAMQYAWWETKVAGTDRFVLVAMADYCNERGECYGSAANLARKTGLSDRAVRYSLKRLQEVGEITLVEKGGFAEDGRSYANVWRLENVKSPLGTKCRMLRNSLPHDLGTKCPPTVNTDNNKEEQERSPQAATVTGADKPPKDNNSLPSSQKKPKSSFDPLSIPLPHGPRFRHVWGEWTQHRKEKRNPLTPLAASKQLKELATLSEEGAMECIATSIKNGWSGLFPDNHRKKSDVFRKPPVNIIPAPKSAGWDDELALARSVG